MASSPVSRLRRCTHSTSIEPFRQNFDFDITKERAQCYLCEVRGPNLWLCLNRDCLTVACGDACRDHSLVHYQRNQEHCVQLNLTTWRMWCYLCECEVVLEREELLPRTPPLPPFRQESDECRAAIADAAGKPCGLTGLQNIGNTCYMNAALQALSNTPPLTQYFLSCCATGGGGPPASQALSRAYHKLVHELWHTKRLGYVPPNGIFYAIRNVHPMFRNYHQHDTQEFLRCFMDQLHEELKVPVLEPPAPHTALTARLRHAYPFNEKHAGSISSEEGELNGGVERVEGGASSQSDGEEYETCDSGVSERSSLSDEGSNTCSKTTRSLSRTPSPTQEKLRSNLTAPSKSYNNRLGSPTRGSHRSHRKQQVKYRSIISDVFDGKLLSSVQCLTCNRISTQVETFQDLSLPIPSRDHLNMLHQSSVNSALAKCSQLYANNDQGWLNWLWVWVCSWFWGPTVGLHDCLSAFFSADELKGDNMYSCEKCNKLRNGVKFSKVLDLPEVLCIHLKRFRHELMFSSKINSYVTFPLDGLDLRPYLHKDCVSEVTSYNLMSVICHHGAAGSGGHYTCYSLNSHTDQWYEFDDQCVTRVSPDTVRSSEAYVLFYRKSGGSVGQHRKRVASLVELTLDHPEPHYFVCKQWVNRFKTFAEPGPIDNRDLVCAHGSLIAGTAQAIGTTVTSPIWEYLLDKFGGGPACRTDQAAVCLLCCQETAARQLATKEHHAPKTSELLHAELLADFKRELDSSSKREHSSLSEPTSLEQVKISPVGSDALQEEVKQPVMADYSQQFWQLYGDEPQTLVSQPQAGTLNPAMRLCPDMECDPEATPLPQTCQMQTEGMHKNFSSTAWQRRKRGSVGYQQAAASGLSDDHIQHLTSAVLDGSGENDAGSETDEESQEAAHSDSVQCCSETAESHQVTGPIMC